MAFFAFHLDRIDFRFQRGKVPDNDIVTFGAFVNQIDRGHGAGLFTDLVSGAQVPSSAVPESGIIRPDLRRRFAVEWLVGPLEIAPGDGVTVVYSGTNISDSTDANAQQQSDIELKILDALTNAVLTAAAGPLGDVVGKVLDGLGDPIGKILGVSHHNCNGLVFSDAVQFVGSGLEKLAFSHTTMLPDAQLFSFTKSYTDETTHDSDQCGHIAETDVRFSVIRLSSLSLRFYNNAGMFFPGKDLSKGLRQLGTPGSTIRVRSLLTSMTG
jgi:hypothetical protein